MPVWPTHLVIILLLFLFSFWRLIPLLPQVSTHIPGDIMDSAEYPLNAWWTAHALLDLKTNPFKNTHMFFPLGLNMVQHTYTFLDGLFFSLLRPLIPLIIFHNLLIWFTFFLNTAAAYGLIFYITRTPWLAFIGALAFGLCPTLISYYKTASLLEVYTFVFFVFFSVCSVQKQKWSWAALSGLVWGLSLYNYPYYFIFCGLWLLLLIGYQLWPWELKPNHDPQGKTPLWVSNLIRISLVGLFVFPVLAPRRLWAFLDRSNLINWLSFSGFILILISIWSIFRLKAGSKETGKGRKGKKWIQGEAALFFGELPLRWHPPPFRQGILWLGFSGITLGIAALVGFPYFLSYINEEATRLAVVSPLSEFAAYSVDLASFFAPFNTGLEGLYQRIAVDWKLERPIVGTPAFLGYGFILILLWGMGHFFSRAELRLWLIAWGVFLVLSLGPYLKVHGLINETLPLPAYGIRFLPVFESARTLSRYLVPVMLFLCLLVCLILKPFYQRRSSKGKILLIGALFLLVVFEYGLLPRPVSLRFSDYRIPEVYRKLAQQAGNRSGVLLDLPLFTHSGTRSAGHGETRRFYYQTVHQQKIIGGVSSKLDESVFAFFQNQPAIPKLWSLQPVDRDELAALIYAFGIEWLVLDKRYYPPENLTSYRTLLDSAPFFKSFHEDSRFLGFVIDPKSTLLKEKAFQYWGKTKALSGLIYPGFNRPLKSGQPVPLELVVPQTLWNHLDIEIKAETVQSFRGLKLCLPNKPEIGIPFPDNPSHDGQKRFIIRLKDFLPFEPGRHPTIRATLIPGTKRPEQTLGRSPFRISLLSLGQASGFHRTSSQALIQDTHFFIDQRGITAFRISPQGRVLEKASFDTHGSIQSAHDLTAWLRNFPNKDYLALVVHDEGSRSLTPAVSDLLRTFGAADPLKPGDWRHSYCFLGKKGGHKGATFESHTVSAPSVVHSPGRTIELSDIRLASPETEKNRKKHENR